MRRRTKILATIGPASREPAVLDALLRAGCEVAVLQDLQGPKIRLGDIDGEVRVAQGARLVITTRDIVGKGDVVPTAYPALARDVSAGMLLSRCHSCAVRKTSKICAR